jgi:hypothetical protein
MPLSKRSRIIALVGLGACLVSLEIVGLRALDRACDDFARGIGAAAHNMGNVVQVVSALSKMSQSIPHPPSSPQK